MSAERELAEQRAHAEWVRDHLTARDMDGISAVNLNERLLRVLDIADALRAVLADREPPAEDSAEDGA